jgi:hypothetical protein
VSPVHLARKLLKSGKETLGVALWDQAPALNEANELPRAAHRFGHVRLPEATGETHEPQVIACRSGFGVGFWPAHSLEIGTVTENMPPATMTPVSRSGSPKDDGARPGEMGTRWPC